MELRHLRYFIAVAEELNFRKAAKRLRIAQPPLSQQIRQLEEEIGIRLFHRSTHGVSLTDPGLVMLSEAKAVLSRVDDAIRTAQLAEKGKTEAVRVAVGGGLGRAVSDIIAEYTKQFPQVDVACRAIPSGPQFEALRERRVDIGIGFLRPYLDSVEFDSASLYEERLSAVVSVFNPLSKYHVLRPEQLASETLMMIGRESSSAIYDKGLELYRRGGGKRTIETDGASPWPLFEELAIKISSGKGICIVAGAPPFPASFEGLLKGVPLYARGAKVEVLIAWRRAEESTCVHDFVSAVRTFFKSKDCNLPHKS
jgi:DNA-binding transcriptional LysR family regulator